jgi:hypothetical protein
LTLPEAWDCRPGTFLAVLVRALRLRPVSLYKKGKERKEKKSKVSIFISFAVIWTRGGISDGENSAGISRKPSKEPVSNTQIRGENFFSAKPGVPGPKMRLRDRRNFPEKKLTIGIVVNTVFG